MVSLQALADEQLIVSRASLVGKGTGFGKTEDVRVGWLKTKD